MLYVGSTPGCYLTCMYPDILCHLAERQNETQTFCTCCKYIRTATYKIISKDFSSWDTEEFKGDQDLKI